MWAIGNETNERDAPPENGAFNTTKAKPQVKRIGEEIEMSGREAAIKVDSWNCCIV